MMTSFTIWCAVAAMMVAVILWRVYLSVHAGHVSHGRRGSRLRPIVSMGTERESIWMPGDRLVTDKYYGDYDDD